MAKVGADHPLGLVMQNGSPVPNCGSGDGSFIKIRDYTSGGVIANGPTLEEAIITSGEIPIEGVGAVSIYWKFNKGSLTNASIYPQFSDNGKATWYQPCTYMNADTSVVIGQASYVWTVGAAATGVFTVPNPGASWMRIYSASSGTTTSSLLGLHVSRHWAPINPISVLA